MLSKEKQTIIDWIEGEKENIIQFLRELIAIPSDNPPGDCYAIAEHIYKRLHDFQFEDVALLEVDPEEVKEKGMVRIPSRSWPFVK